MALNIEGATVGFDQDGVRNLLSDIKANVIQEAQDQLKTSVGELDTALDDIWQGKSEERFKSNMHEDVETICDALDDAYNSLVAEIGRARDAMGAVDNTLVEKY